MAKSNFSACLVSVLAFEGGRVDDPRDPGGRTNEGVTQRTYDAWRREQGLAARDVYAMAAQDRDAIYAARFWAPTGGDDLPAGVDLAVFDAAVNSGPARAKHWLIAAQAEAGASETAVIAGLCARRLSFLHALGTWSRFGRGWGRRVAAIEAAAQRMALGRSAQASATIVALAATHRARAASHGTRAKATGGALVVSGATAAATGHHDLVLLLALAGLLAVALAGFAAWRAGQRADALAAAAKR